jgi:hypothetical protein
LPLVNEENYESYRYFLNVSEIFYFRLYLGGDCGITSAPIMTGISQSWKSLLMKENNS